MGKRGRLGRCKEKNISGPYWGSGPEELDVGTNFRLGCRTATDSTLRKPSTDQWLSHCHQGLDVKLNAEYLFGMPSHVVAVFSVQNYVIMLAALQQRHTFDRPNNIHDSVTAACIVLWAAQLVPEVTALSCNTTVH